MQDHILLTVTVVTDDDTGMYQIGELDFGIRGTCGNYIEKPENREKLANWLQMLADRCRNSQSPFGATPTREQRLAQQFASAALPNKAINSDPKSGSGGSDAIGVGE